MKRILTDEQEQLLTEERGVLGNLQVVLARAGAAEDDGATLAQSIRQLDELFLLVVAGEFNSGKSALVNALLGTPVLPEGVTPTTSEVEILRYGEGTDRVRLEEHLFARTAPVDLLREIHVVDTPGTNAVIREHELITDRFLPRADLVLFVTSADRPFTETERAFLERIRAWGRKVVIAINKVDILEHERDVELVRSFVRDHATRLLGTVPEIFPVSARLAMKAKHGEPASWAPSGFEALEVYVRETLDEEHRVRLKLLAPLGVAAHLLERQRDSVASRLDLLKDDLALLEDIDSQLEAYRRDMGRHFDVRMGDIEKVVVEMEQRGHRFFDEMLRIARVFELLNKSRIQERFEREVVADAPKELERKVEELIDWLVDADLRQWQAVTRHLAERPRRYSERMVDGGGLLAFHQDRARLIDSAVREAQRVVETYDKSREAQDLASDARMAVAATAAVGAGALGIGATVMLMASTAAVDATGVVMATVVAVLGLFILPQRRERAKQQMRAKVTVMREKLVRALRSEFEREMQRSRERIAEGMRPYAGFVRSEHEKLSAMRTTLETTQHEIETLRDRIERRRRDAA